MYLPTQKQTSKHSRTLTTTQPHHTSYFVNNFVLAQVQAWCACDELSVLTDIARSQPHAVFHRMSMVLLVNGLFFVEPFHIFSIYWIILLIPPSFRFLQSNHSVMIYLENC